MKSFTIAITLVAYLLAEIFAYPGHDDYNSPVQYNFKYGVDDPNTGDHKQQEEVRVGHTVKGTYSLAEPDGTLRIVEYDSAPYSGFNAVVKQVGHAQHPPRYH